MIAKFGTGAPSAMDQRAQDCEANGDLEAAGFWHRIALAARLLIAPQESP
jgi:hypothetical protein